MTTLKGYVMKKGVACEVCDAPERDFCICEIDINSKSDNINEKNTYDFENVLKNND